MSKGKIIYSSDGSGVNLVKEQKVEKNFPEVIPSNTTLKLRIEKNGRGGKTVTVIFDLPNNPVYFKDLTKKIKNHCGTGGSFKEDSIDIQGDQITKIRNFLTEMGFKVKG